MEVSDLNEKLSRILVTWLFHDASEKMWQSALWYVTTLWLVVSLSWTEKSSATGLLLCSCQIRHSNLWENEHNISIQLGKNLCPVIGYVLVVLFKDCFFLLEKELCVCLQRIILNISLPYVEPLVKTLSELESLCGTMCLSVLTLCGTMCLSVLTLWYFRRIQKRPGCPQAFFWCEKCCKV